MRVFASISLMVVGLFYCIVQTVSFLAAGRMSYTQCGERAHGMRAARGHLDQKTPIMQTIVTSVQVNLQWYNKYTQVWQALYQMQMQRIKTAGRMSKIISQTHNEISDMMHQSWKRRQASEDRIHKQWTQSMRGVEEYYNPIERRPVELPGGYREAWITATASTSLATTPTSTQMFKQAATGKKFNAKDDNRPEVHPGDWGPEGSIFGVLIRHE